MSYQDKLAEYGKIKPGIVDLFYLRSPDKNSAVGVLANRTYNWYTQWDVTKCGTFVWEGEDEKYIIGVPDNREEFECTYPVDEISYNDYMYSLAKTSYCINESIGINVRKLRTYNISYIDPLTLQVVITQTKYNATGKLNLDFPYLTGTDTRPILLVKIELKNDKTKPNIEDSLFQAESKFSEQNLQYRNDVFGNNKAKIYPNPTNDFVKIELPEYCSNCHLDLLSCSGKNIMSFDFAGAEFLLSINAFPQGIYILRLVYNDSIETTKILKQ